MTVHTAWLKKRSENPYTPAVSEVCFARDTLSMRAGGMGSELSRAIGLRVKRARQSANLTQSQLAERIDRTKEAVSNIERGVNLPGLDTLQAICDVMGVPLTAVVGPMENDRDTQDQRAQLNGLFGRLSDRDQRLLVAIARTMLERT